MTKEEMIDEIIETLKWLSTATQPEGKPPGNAANAIIPCYRSDSVLSISGSGHTASVP